MAAEPRVLEVTALVLLVMIAASAPTLAGTDSRIVFAEDDRANEFKGRLVTANLDWKDEVELVHRGTESPAWSPSGNRVVFVKKKNLYSIGADGSDMKRLTSTPGKEEEPAWSPTGRKIVYEMRGDLFVIRAGGSNRRRLTHTDLSEWSPTWSTTEKIAFSRGGDIFKMDEQGEEITLLTKNGGGPDWSPNGHRLAFTKRFNSKTHIFTMTAQGEDVTRLTRRGGEVCDQKRFAFSPSWDPNGGRIVFISQWGLFPHQPPFYNNPAEVWMVRADGSNEHAITYNHPFSCFDGTFRWHWDPDIN